MDWARSRWQSRPSVRIPSLRRNSFWLLPRPSSGDFVFTASVHIHARRSLGTVPNGRPILGLAIMDSDTAPLVRSKNGTPGSLCGKVVWTSACPMKASDPALISTSLISEASAISLSAREGPVTTRLLCVHLGKQGLGSVGEKYLMLWHRNTCRNFYIGAISMAVEMRLFRLRFKRAELRIPLVALERLSLVGSH